MVSALITIKPEIFSNFVAESQDPSSLSAASRSGRVHVSHESGVQERENFYHRQRKGCQQVPAGLLQPPQE